MWFEWNVSHIFRHLNMWSPAAGAIWGGLGGVVLMEDINHWGRTLRFKASHHPVYSLCFLFMAQLVNPQLSASISSYHAYLLPCFPTTMDLLLLEPWVPNKLFLLEVALVTTSHSNRKLTNPPSSKYQAVSSNKRCLKYILAWSTHLFFPKVNFLCVALVVLELAV